MSKLETFSVTYDRVADVLYIGVHAAVAVRAIEDGSGIVWRYDGQGDLVGATVLDFLPEWSRKPSRLAHEFVQQFGLSISEARDLLDRAMRLASPDASRDPARAVGT